MFDMSHECGHIMVNALLVITAVLVQGGAGVSTTVVAPRLPITTTAGGEVLLHVKLDTAGTPELIFGILETPPFAEALREAVREWQLPWAAAEAGPDILVAGVFRSPALLELSNLPTPPSSAAIAPRVLPFPVEWARPAYPPTGTGDAVVIVELRVGETGGIRGATVVRSTPGFDAAAVDAAWQWRFRPAVRDGRPVSTIAYLVFGFRAPVTAANPPPR
jgi:TonB family protein